MMIKSVKRTITDAKPQKSKGIMVLKGFLNFVLLLTGVFCTLAFAQGDRATVLSSIEECETFPHLCIDEAERQVAQVPKYSKSWYRYKYLSISAKWVDKKLNMDRKELAELAALEDAPPFFKATAYTLHAKMLFTDGKKEQGTHFADLATDLLLMNNLVAPHPKHCAELINLANYMGDHERALALSNWSLERGKSLVKPEFQAEIFTAVAHTHGFVNNLEAAREYYLKALNTKDFADPSPTRPILLANAGLIHQRLEQYKAALGYFEQARDAYELLAEGFGNFGRQHIELRAAQTLVSLGEKDKARAILIALEPFKINPAHQWIFDELYRQVM